MKEHRAVGAVGVKAEGACPDQELVAIFPSRAASSKRHKDELVKESIPHKYEK